MNKPLSQDIIVFDDETYEYFHEGIVELDELLSRKEPARPMIVYAYGYHNIMKHIYTAVNIDCYVQLLEYDNTQVELEAKFFNGVDTDEEWCQDEDNFTVVTTIHNSLRSAYIDFMIYNSHDLSMVNVYTTTICSAYFNNYYKSMTITANGLDLTPQYRSVSQGYQSLPHTPTFAAITKTGRVVLCDQVVDITKTDLNNLHDLTIVLAYAGADLYLPITLGELRSMNYLSVGFAVSNVEVVSEVAIDSHYDGSVEAYIRDMYGMDILDMGYKITNYEGVDILEIQSPTFKVTPFTSSVDTNTGLIRSLGAIIVYAMCYRTLELLSDSQNAALDWNIPYEPEIVFNLTVGYKSKPTLNNPDGHSYSAFNYEKGGIPFNISDITGV